MKDDMEIRILAAASGLTELPAEFYPGIRFNLDLLRSYGALVEGLELSDRLEPAFEYEP
ncbi:DUF4089 domain-containing protein [Gluconobacter wancherniae]|uniref:DUF4089 domain-containing protein n=1 Tax=Gluconobacter wancherniae TaxID=1307955 RepID=UPI001B8A8DAD|nr:DUF4089 domain-containing protein [Gluconobacter wancherniae]MBS1062728.1 DUF4089 domain-containing protein [Gluconobacter wancherniae]MBS1088536.1 DUF4089 domain-containing protein [Gluconobacter wancherniae]MBS1094863.1 DUF4089 domain-containing protein [Gluconobacter wancherniae]